ncbi:MAG: phosphoribosyltransferase family protein [bacterium]|nr:phosphoribosyltransferase family protein [bacterium]
MRTRYSYAQFENDVNRITRKLRPLLGRFDAIYGIPRGGLVLAVHLSYRLGKPLVLEPSRITRRTLVVDDIAGSGKTLRALLTRHKCFRVATLYRTAQTEVMPDFVCRRTKKDEWIVFPWETNASSRYDDTTK